MGHLTKIANSLVQSSEKGPNALLIGQLLKGEDTELIERSTAVLLREKKKVKFLV